MYLITFLFVITTGIKKILNCQHMHNLPPLSIATYDFADSPQPWESHVSDDS
jgi:hypothetical protein